MPKNPFGDDQPGDALGPPSSGAWGAGAGQGAGGFGAGAGLGAQPFPANDAEEYDVVDIADPGASEATAGKKPSSGVAPSFGRGAKASSRAGNPKELTAWENQLKKREAELARREAAVRAAGPQAASQIKNWPPFMPIVHHDITADIPESKRGITRAGFFVFLMTVAALTYNLLAVVISVIIADVGGIASSIIFAIIFAIVGVPGAWFIWYMSLYHAMMHDGATSFAAFFFSFIIHIVFAGYSTIAPPFGGPSAHAHAGLLSGIDILDGGGGNKIAGILFLIGGLLWGGLTLISVLFLGRVYRFFRSSGAEERARAQAQSAATRHALTTF